MTKFRLFLPLTPQLESQRDKAYLEPDELAQGTILARAGVQPEAQHMHTRAGWESQASARGHAEPP